ncbi:endothelin-converting enzyme homolog isoform X2 [Littorina saxatilis]|uniref:endothelin-converting enzyme homolog isoform X2 n=1 Tax=Littorina saxatilis TaxID=31220 RepID=UPI0038B5A2CF
MATGTEVCLTPECVDVSAYIMRKMNQTADPCEDFYTYSCGGWESATFIPPERAKYDTFAEVHTNNVALVKRLMDDTSTVYKGHNSSSVAKLKVYYQTCMDVDKIESDGTAPMLKWIKKLGSWSITLDSDRNKTEGWDLTSALVNFQQHGQAPLFVFSLAIDSKNRSRHLLSFSQGGLTLNSQEEYLQDADKFKVAFMDFAVRVGRLLGGDNSTQQKMEAIYDFEKKLAEIFMNKEELIDPMSHYNLMTVADLQRDIGDQVDLKRMMSSVLQKDISADQTIIVSTVKYFRKLGPLLANTSQQVLQDYLMWHVIQRLPGYMPQRFVDAAMGLNKVELGVSTTSPRWQRCVSKAEAAFGFASSALYVDKTFPPESKAQALKILTAVQSAFIANLDNLKWMDRSTRDKAKVKATAMGKVLGYPEWLLDPQKLDDYYQEAQVKKGEFLNNFFSVAKYEKDRLWKKWVKTPVGNEWSMLPDEVNAFFSSTYNHIVILAGLLQRPYFDLNFPRSFAYGAMGMISGHELTHGFDNTGRKFDKDGNMNDWWTETSAQAFQRHTQCMVDQYSNFSMNGKHFNGEYTLGENIADNGGLKLGYAAYQKVKSRGEGKEPKLPGLELSPQQLFFVGFAQIWCAHYTPEYAANAIRSDEHTISKYRVLGSVANSAPFAEAFNCPVGSPLNPSHKCNVW